MSRTLQEVLDTDLSPDKVKEMSLGELNNFLLNNEIVESQDDIKMLVVEGVQKALNEDDEFPIRYYAKDEEMPEEAKIVSNPGPMLTDGYIDNLKSGD